MSPKVKKMNKNRDGKWNGNSYANRHITIGALLAIGMRIGTGKVGVLAENGLIESNRI